MRIVNLIENTEEIAGCAYMHGLSFYAETKRKKSKTKIPTKTVGEIHYLKRYQRYGAFGTFAVGITV